MNHLHASWLEYYTMFSLNRGWIRVERVRSNAIQYNRLSRKEVSERLLFGSLCDVVDAILVFFSWLQQHKHKKEVSERFVGLLTQMGLQNIPAIQNLSMYVGLKLPASNLRFT